MQDGDRDAPGVARSGEDLPREFLRHVIHEVDLVVAMSQDLQEALNLSCPKRVPPETRRSLQDVDRLTQSLQCIRTALAGLAAPAPPGFDLEAVLDGIVLQEVAHRLRTGETATQTSRVQASGTLDLF